MRSLRIHGTYAVLLLPLAGLAFAPPVPPANKANEDAIAAFKRTVRPFFRKNCFDCHNSLLKVGGLNLESYTGASISEHRDKWEKILARLSAREMPPPSMPRPDAAAQKQVMDWIRAEFDRADLNAKPDPGRVTARRLNRAEYNNTVRDLLGVDFNPAADFPQDDSGYGFDNNGDVLSLSIIQMEKYLSAAEAVARTAVYGPQASKPVSARYQPYGRRRPGDFDSLFFNTHPWLSVNNYDETGLSMPNSFHVMHRFPVTGDYVIRATPDNGQRPPGSEPLAMAVFIDGVQVGETSIDGDLEGKTKEFPVRVTAGEHWLAAAFPRQFEGLPSPYDGKNPSKLPIPERLMRVPANGGRGIGGSLGPNGQQGGSNNDAASTPKLPRPDNMAVQSLEIAGPKNADVSPSPESLKKIFICGQYKGEHPAGCERQIVEHLARQAYRRPVTKTEIDQLMAQVTRARLRGDPFEEQIVVAIEALLMSPNLLFRVEKDPPAAQDSYQLSDYELGSRLSYFLWSSMPDAELMRAAESGQLHQPEVLNAQVQRMLKDPKISRFVEDFGGQWLQFRALESHTPDFYKFPLWDNYLRFSAVKETEMFFENLIREDRSITDFLDADYTFANQYLADFYGIHDVKGPEFRKVSLANTPRRGLLGQVSVLTATSYGNRTSVVLRGKWVLENLLNAPPPPPPPNVPDLESANVAEEATLRQKMEAHRANAMCASCHRKMDPLGFGLENFDAIGSWRDLEGKSPIDASATLPDGRHFNGPAELAVTLRSQSDAFAQALTEKMMTFALGRGLEGSDRGEVKKIAARVIQGQYRFSEVVLGIVNSMPFQMRKADSTGRTPVAEMRENRGNGTLVR